MASQLVAYYIYIIALFYLTLYYIPNPTQYLNLTTTLLTINKQQIRNVLRENL